MWHLMVVEAIRLLRAQELTNCTQSFWSLFEVKLIASLVILMNFFPSIRWENAEPSGDVRSGWTWVHRARHPQHSPLRIQYTILGIICESDWQREEPHNQLGCNWPTTIQHCTHSLRKSWSLLINLLSLKWPFKSTVINKCNFAPESTKSHLRPFFCAFYDFVSHSRFIHLAANINFRTFMLYFMHNITC